MKRTVVVLLAAVIIIAVYMAGFASRPGDPDEPIGLGIHDDIRMVYQIKTDDRKQGVGAGLYYVNKLMKAYEKLGVDSGEVYAHAVLHGDAGYWLLKDSQYDRADETRSENPNKSVVKQLLNRGVSVELCASTMRNNGWTQQDVLEGIKIVAGAYPRIIDLQLRGHAYIRF
ncbi:hypothetical protein STSP2_03350 [Anaerohalosphaera lusitana]|uniref:Uncharacterized protein n=1 Tax=Anaerohalosphaera lusitana TaxID=1936003 RepID=A0A1U9NRJ1_9BACT|nr:DsrE family protein [Anaerohalosphaera lusitana]AQT70146.1 hypothetical protein STSP2_03350 [Anaerohalosphaera lusitana]